MARRFVIGRLAEDIILAVGHFILIDVETFGVDSVLRPLVGEPGPREADGQGVVAVVLRVGAHGELSGGDGHHPLGHRFEGAARKQEPGQKARPPIQPQ